MLGRLVAILTFGRRTDSLTGPAKVIDGDTIVMAGQLVRLHGIDAPELDQPLWWQGRKLVRGTMVLAALEALTAGSKFAARWSSGTGTVASLPRSSRPMGSTSAAGW
jgi:endonuclease YncB( thermonuclease family)